MSKLALVIGQGEIGSPIFELLAEAYSPEDIFFRDIEEPGWHHNFMFLHICFPQTVDWAKHIWDYIGKYDPKAVIIHSTVHPGTTDALNKLQPIFYYSPVRGNISDGMKWSLRKYTKYLAGPPHKPSLITSASEQEVAEHLGNAFKVQLIPDTTSLEYAKILDLCWYGLNIAFYQELERIAEALDYRLIREFIESTPLESEGKVPRVVYYGGYIGGHCVIPAFEKILALHDVPMIKAALDSNIKRERELIVNPSVLLGKQ